MSIITEILRKCGLASMATPYHFLSIKNRYPCRITAERIDPLTQETNVVYRVSPRRDEFEIKLKSLLDQPLLIEKFHPTETIRLGFMAFGDIFFNQSKEDAHKQYQHIIQKMNQSMSEDGHEIK